MRNLRWKAVVVMPYLKKWGQIWLKFWICNRVIDTGNWKIVSLKSKFNNLFKCVFCCSCSVSCCASSTWSCFCFVCSQNFRENATMTFLKGCIKRHFESHFTQPSKCVWKKCNTRKQNTREIAKIDYNKEIMNLITFSNDQMTTPWILLCCQNKIKVAKWQIRLHKIGFFEKCLFYGGETCVILLKCGGFFEKCLSGYTIQTAWHEPKFGWRLRPDGVFRAECSLGEKLTRRVEILTSIRPQEGVNIWHEMGSISTF